MLFPNSCLEQITVPTRELRYRLLRGGWAGSRAPCHGARRESRSVPGRNWGALEVPACYVSMLEKPPQSTVVPKRYRHLSKRYRSGARPVQLYRLPCGPKGIKAWIKGARQVHLGSGVHQEVNITILHDHMAPVQLYSPPHQVLTNCVRTNRL